MIVHVCEQQSVEWGQLRAGVLTASEFKNLVTPKFQIRTGEMPETLLAYKLAEWWLGGPMIDACTYDMDQGNALEEEARPRLALELGKTIDTVGFITTDDGKAGCSPDGLIENKKGAEIKCPQPVAHVKALLDGVPEKYLAQVHGGMFVTGFESWIYFDYRRGFPFLLAEVERLDRIQAVLREAIDTFLFRFDEGKSHLIELNGGPPKRLRFERQTEAPFVSEMPS